MEANLMNLVQFAVLAPAQFLIAGIWQGLLLAAMAWIGLKAFPKISPKNRFILWFSVFVLAALLPLFAGYGAPAPGATALIPLVPLSGAAAASAASIPVPHLPGVWAEALVGFWVLASLLSLARLLWNGRGLWLLSRTAVPIRPEALDPELRDILARSASRPIEVCLSPRVDSPAVIGFFRRIIVIPEWLLNRLTQPELKQVLIHEVAHLDRRDDWTNLLQKVFRALFPLNPALILADRQLCREREMACDDAVLDAAVTPRAYATCLAALAEKRILHRAGSLAPGAWRGRRSELAERVHRILENNRRLGAGPALAVFLSAFLFVGVGLARCPQMVTFTTAARDPLPNPPKVIAAMRTSPPAEFHLATFRALSSPSSPHGRALRRATPRRRLKPRASSSRPAHIKEADFLDPSSLPPGFAQPISGSFVSPVVLELWEPSTSPIIFSGGDLPFPAIAIFQSRTSWIVIQL